ncbi:hypothetical protein ADIS_1628 [Lunatimonas lonarensis]|uniref:Uncharacterized protein n=1 Tax=Lunatimonas lonarensis TaxID=1232681 RepID=R7ZUU0_9BACT|nr:hypothetical protein ADIS_1628 [Lunatimonas lonarensis]
MNKHFQFQKEQKLLLNMGWLFLLPPLSQWRVMPKEAE